MTDSAKIEVDHSGFDIGDGAGSQGTINVNGGTLIDDLDQEFNVGTNNGTGSANFNGGSYSGLSPVIGSGGTGTLALTNKAAVTGVNLLIGFGSTQSLPNPSGIVTLDNSSMTLSGNFGIGNGSGASSGNATGMVTLSNAATLSQNADANIGTAGATGTLNVFSGSMADIVSDTVIGGNGGTGSVRVSGTNTAMTEGVILIGEDFSNMPGTGTLQVDSNATINIIFSLTVASGGTLNVLSGGTLSAESIDLHSAGSVNLTGGTINLTGGTLTDPSLSLPKTSTLEGTGTLTGNLSSDGTVSPGDAPGILKVSGNYIQNSDADLDIGIGGATRSSKYDQLDIVGSASLNGTLDITLLNGFVPVIGNQFNILAFGSESGSFSSYKLPALPTGESWDANQLYTSGIIDVVVPEPATGALLLAGVRLAMRRRRRG